MVSGSQLTKKKLFEEDRGLYMIYLEDLIFQMTGTTRTEQALYNDEEFLLLAMYASEKAIHQEREMKKAQSKTENLNRYKGK